jgi:hypothetical protein
MCSGREILCRRHTSAALLDMEAWAVAVLHMEGQILYFSADVANMGKSQDCGIIDRDEHGLSSTTSRKGLDDLQK